MPTLRFPEGFRWGVATSSYQIEGALDVDGRGEGIWDRFCRIPGAIADGRDASVACDHYHRWPEDVALMRALGITAYRFSVSWPRILPQGRGPVNQAGLDFYHRLVDALLAAGITPYVTLYHWDLPTTLEDAGGWPVRATAEAFAEFADVTSQALGDRVKHWITINEPWCASFLDYAEGRHAPGRTEWPAAIAASHHLLLGHGWAIPLIRRNSPGAQAGITLNFTASVPASPSPADRDAARTFDGYFNRWFLDPLHGHLYPADMVADFTAAGFLPDGLAFIQPGDMAAITTPTDFLGVNYYTREVLRSSRIPEDQNAPRTVQLASPEQRTAMGWEIYPQGFYALLMRLQFHYAPPALLVTENGIGLFDQPGADGQVPDPRRIAYLHDHLAAAHRAISAGVQLTGYFVWSLMDNFEWDRGYRPRFGLVYVDYATRQRIPKASFAWFRDVIASNQLES